MIIDDGGMIVAGRAFGGWGPSTFGEGVLIVTAGPAIVVTAFNIVHEADVGAATRVESHLVAMAAFVLSTAWWVTIGALVSWLSRRRRSASDRLHSS